MTPTMKAARGTGTPATRMPQMLLILTASISLVAGCALFPGGGEGDHQADAGSAAGPTGPGDMPPSGPPSDRTLYFYYGPMKIMAGETILYSIETYTGHDFGGWTFTAPEPTSRAFIDAGNSSAYYRHCRQLGGCMEHRIPLGRTSFVGTGYVLQLETAVVEACYDRAAFGMFPGSVPPTEATPAIDLIRYQYRKAFAAEPDDEDLEIAQRYVDAHLRDPEFTDMSALESAGRGLCRALLTTNRFLFY